MNVMYEPGLLLDLRPYLLVIAVVPDRCQLSQLSVTTSLISSGRLPQFVTNVKRPWNWIGEVFISFLNLFLHQMRSPLFLQIAYKLLIFSSLRR